LVRNNVHLVTLGVLVALSIYNYTHLHVFTTSGFNYLCQFFIDTMCAIRPVSAGKCNFFEGTA
jgi:hypothetical protein